MHQLLAQAMGEDTWKKLEGSNPMFLGPLILSSVFFLSLIFLVPFFGSLYIMGLYSRVYMCLSCVNLWDFDWIDGYLILGFEYTIWGSCSVFEIG